MELIFISNYFNHHQSALCDALYEETGGKFRFIQTMPMEQERKDMGWGDIELPSYVKCSYTSKEAYNECVSLINSAGAVMIGSAPNGFIKQRLKEGKLVFRYSERLYKNWKRRATLPLRFIKYHTYNHGDKNVYLLCASAYAAKDYSLTFNYIGKSFKWGYFPKVKEYDDIDSLIDNKTPNSILWVARFLKFKHPEIPVEIAKMLKENGYRFELKMIGDGAEKEKIENLIEKYNLHGCVKLLGSMSHSQVREYMEKSELFLFTSDKSEGWGAVLNEAMNSGCAVIANNAIGSVPYLISDGENGLTYGGEIKDIYNKAKELLESAMKRKKLGANAYKTMATVWNAQNAAKRLVRLTDYLLNGKSDFPYSDGPCSKAEQR